MSFIVRDANGVPVSLKSYGDNDDLRAIDFIHVVAQGVMKDE